MTDSPDVVECARFLQLWTAVTDLAHVTLVAIHPTTGAIAARSFARGDGDVLSDWIDGYQRNGRNIYFQPNETKPYCTRKPGKADMVAAVSRFADIDPDDTRFSWIEERDRLHRLAEALAASELPPTVIIDSGNGMQPIWVVERAVLTPEVITRVEAETAALERALGASGTHNVDRLLRLPGTVNYPNKVKLEKGRSVTRSRLIFAGANVYRIDQAGSLVNGQLEEAGLVRPRPDTASTARHTADPPEVGALIKQLEQAQVGGVISKLEDLAGDLQARLAAAMMLDPETMTDQDYARRKRLVDRWAGLVDDLTEAGRDSSRSGADLSLAAMLKTAGFTHLDCALILLAFEHGQANNAEWATEAVRLRHVARCALRSHEPSSEPDLPTITVRRGQRHLAADAGLAAMAAAGVAFYQRDKVLVRVCRITTKASDGTLVSVPAVTQVTSAMLGRALGQVARWKNQIKASGEAISIDPPKEVVEQIGGMAGEWPFQPLYGVISTPTMRPDGSILATEGYDPTTGFVLLATPPMPAIPERPTKQDALEAVATLNALLIDFPFANEPSRSVAMSMLMTPVLRAALPPAVPAHVITAPEAGTGKSYLQDIAAAIAIGDRCPVMSISTDANETEKRLIGAALAQFPIIALDNVSTLLMGDFLCQVTERPVLQIRPLGSSNMIRLANTFTAFANGNNCTVGADFVRRTLQCALDSGLENPETREFSVNPVAMVLADRGKYIAAILTIARAYIVAGRPGRLPQRASYEGWSDTVRSALVWLGWRDPVDSLTDVQAADPIRQQRAAVFSAWIEELTPNVGYQTRDLIKQAEQYTFSERARPALYEALFAVAAPHSGQPQIDPKRLGQWLLRNVDTIARGHKLLVDRSDASRPRWRMSALS